MHKWIEDDLDYTIGLTRDKLWMMLMTKNYGNCQNLAEKNWNILLLVIGKVKQKQEEGRVLMKKLVMISVKVLLSTWYYQNNFQTKGKLQLDINPVSRENINCLQGRERERKKKRERERWNAEYDEGTLSKTW